MNKRVLLVARILDSSGVTTHILTLAKGLQSMGWDVAVASKGQVGEHSYGPKTFESNGIPHFYIDFPDSSLTPKNFIRALKAYLEMDAIVNKFHPNIIHLHWRGTSPYVHMIKLIHKIPFVSSLHISIIASSLLHKIGSFWGDRAIAISAETRDYLIKTYQLPPSNIRIVYNGVDNLYFHPATETEFLNARQTFGLSQKDKVVSLLGRLEFAKGHDVLIKALALLRARGCNVIALFAGEGSYREILAQQASEAGVADLVRQLGYADSRQVLWASDVSVLPSRCEGFGLVTVESMFSGVVHIRTPSAGAYDQIEDGVNGFIMPFDDHEALANRLEELLKDNELKTRMAEAALVTANNKFTQKTMIENTESVYQEVLESNPDF